MNSAEQLRKPWPLNPYKLDPIFPRVLIRRSWPISLGTFYCSWKSRSSATARERETQRPEHSLSPGNKHTHCHPESGSCSWSPCERKRRADERASHLQLALRACGSEGASLRREAAYGSARTAEKPETRNRRHERPERKTHKLKTRTGTRKWNTFTLLAFCLFVRASASRAGYLFV